MNELSTIARRGRRGSRRCTAFTLIEVLVVMVIIAILAAMTVGAVKHASTRSTEARISTEIKSLEVALEAYKLDNGVFPKAVKANGSLANRG